MAGQTVILFHKPYGVLSQFTSREGKRTLSAFGPFPPGVYPVGRLDLDSEGLLLLSDNKPLIHRLTTPRFGHERTYLVQVERIPGPEQLDQLSRGVTIGGKRTRPAIVSHFDGTPDVPQREPSIRFRKNVPTDWLELTLTEGRNRQVRRMTAAVGHPTLRLIRIRVANLRLDGLASGQFRNIRPDELRRLEIDTGLTEAEE